MKRSYSCLTVISHPCYVTFTISLLPPFVSIAVIVPLCHCNTTISILTMYVSSRHWDTQHRPNIQSNSWLKYDINEKISPCRLLHLNVLTICPKQFLVLLFFSHQMPMGMINSVNTMAVNEKVNYIYTCFNGVAIEEWINIYNAVIEFIQIISKLWYEK